MKQKQNIYPKLSFLVTTIGWTYGDCMWIKITAAAGHRFYINWGDGKQEMFIGEGKHVEISHDYCQGEAIYEKDISFRVEIFSNEADCRITELSCLSPEMTLTEFDITHCVELEKLWYDMMFKPNILDVSKNVELRLLSCSNSKISELDISNNTKLITLNCASNNLTKLDLSHNHELRYLSLRNCSNISEIDLSHNKELIGLNYENSEIKNLNLSNNTALRYLNCEENEIKDLNLSNNTALRYLNCQDNVIKNLDLSNNQELQILDCTNNGMNKLSIAKNSRLKEASFVDGNNIDANTEQNIINIMKSNPLVDLSEYDEMIDSNLRHMLDLNAIHRYLYFQ